MKEISLNTCHSEYGEKLEDYVLSMADQGVDFFCLQEASRKEQDFYSKKIPKFSSIFGTKLCNSGGSYDLLTLIKNRCQIIDSQVLLEDPETGLGISTTIKNSDGSLLTLVNLHGVTHPGNKMDTEERIKQSKIIIDFLKNIPGEKIIMGDFNLLPETRSVRMFENEGYINLIKKFDIKSTRNHLTWDKFQHQKGYNKQYFADYCFVSSGIKVKNFEVPYNEVSDHLPLILDFEL